MNKKALLVLLIAMSGEGQAQDKILHYKVLHNGHTIGNMQLTQTRNGPHSYVILTSAIKMRFVVSIRVDIKESAHYQNRQLILSSLRRKVNNKEKANRQTSYSGDHYQTVAEGIKGRIDKTSINYNLMLLYLCEPLNTTHIYSDNFQQFLEIKKTDTHTYRIDLPDGNYNFYHYRDGTCTQVDIHHSLYTIQMALS